MKGLRIVASSVITTAMLLSMVACGGNTPSSTSSSSSSTSSSSKAASSSSSVGASSASSTSSTATSSSSASSSSSVSTSSTAAKKDVPKPKQLYLYMDVFLVEKDGRQLVMDDFAKSTGIKLKVVTPEHSQYAEKLSTLFMSNDIPDVVEVYAADYMKYASQKAFAPMTDYIKNSATLSKLDADFVNTLAYKGQVYGLQKEFGGGSLAYIRKDWMDKLKISMPKTYDEFYNMLVAFRDKDPDGNGVNVDSVGYTVSLKNPDNEIYLADLLIDAKYNFYQKGGKWVDGFAEDAMLKALERMSKMYQQKLIEPDIFTLSTADCKAKYESGQTGVFSYWAGKHADLLNSNLQKNIKDAAVVAMPALPGEKFIKRVSPVFAIPAKPACGNVESVFKYFFEYIMDGDQGTMWSTGGAEGVTYKVENGKSIALPAISAPDVKKDYPSKTMIDGTLTLSSNPRYSFNIPTAWTESMAVYNKSTTPQALIPPVKSYNTIAADVYVLRQETVAKVMKGEMTPAAGMERYRAEMKKLGVDTVLADLNAF